jgi:hypothetical protein
MRDKDERRSAGTLINVNMTSQTTPRIEREKWNNNENE